MALGMRKGSQGQSADQDYHSRAGTCSILPLPTWCRVDWFAADGLTSGIMSLERISITIVLTGLVRMIKLREATTVFAWRVMQQACFASLRSQSPVPDSP